MKNALYGVKLYSDAMNNSVWMIVRHPSKEHVDRYYLTSYSVQVVLKCIEHQLRRILSRGP